MSSSRITSSLQKTTPSASKAAPRRILRTTGRQNETKKLSKGEEFKEWYDLLDKIKVSFPFSRFYIGNLAEPRAMIVANVFCFQDADQGVEGIGSSRDENRNSQDYVTGGVQGERKSIQCGGFWMKSWSFASTYPYFMRNDGPRPRLLRFSATIYKLIDF